MTAYDNRYNILALALCFFKRGSPEILNKIIGNIEEIKNLNIQDSKEKYREEDFYSPKEIFKFLKLF
jgi:hypothetical protein